MAFSSQDMLRVQAYLQKKLGNSALSLRKRDQANDSAEVLLDGEYIGVIYKDEEDKDDVSYDFNMAILDMDLPKSA